MTGSTFTNGPWAIGTVVTYRSCGGVIWKGDQSYTLTIGTGHLALSICTDSCCGPLGAVAYVAGITVCNVCTNAQTYKVVTGGSVYSTGSLTPGNCTTVVVCASLKSEVVIQTVGGVAVGVIPATAVGWKEGICDGANPVATVRAAVCAGTVAPPTTVSGIPFPTNAPGGTNPATDGTLQALGNGVVDVLVSIDGTLRGGLNVTVLGQSNLATELTLRGATDLLGRITGENTNWYYYATNANVYSSTDSVGRSNLFAGRWDALAGSFYGGVIGALSNGVGAGLPAGVMTNGLLQVTMPGVGILPTTTLDFDPEHSAIWSGVFGYVRKILSWLQTVGLMWFTYALVSRKVEAATHVVAKAPVGIEAKIPGVNTAVALAFTTAALTAIAWLPLLLGLWWSGAASISPGTLFGGAGLAPGVGTGGGTNWATILWYFAYETFPVSLAIGQAAAALLFWGVLDVLYVVVSGVMFALVG